MCAFVMGASWFKFFVLNVEHPTVLKKERMKCDILQTELHGARFVFSLVYNF